MGSPWGAAPLPASHFQRVKLKSRRGGTDWGTHQASGRVKTRLHMVGLPQRSEETSGAGPGLSVPERGMATPCWRLPWAEPELGEEDGSSSLSTSVHRCIRLSSRRLLGLPSAAPCMVHSMTLSRDGPCVCSSGPPHSPLLTHLTPLFHQQTLGLERQSNWLAVSYSRLPSLPKQTALFVLSASDQDLTGTLIPAPPATHPLLFPQNLCWLERLRANF